MSYEIEHKKKVIVLEGRYSESDYFAMHEMASNNVRPRTWSWCFMGFGWKYSVIQEVCRVAGFCEGGSIVCYGKWITPENYIKSWRRAIKNAVPFEEFIKHNNLRLFLATKDKIDIRKQKSWNKEKLKKLKRFKKEKNPYSDNGIKYYIDVKTEEDIRDWSDLRGLLTHLQNLSYVHIEVN